jgi:predicted permease
MKLRLTAIIRWFFRRDQMERDLDEELAYHLDKAVAQNSARGMDARDARREALLRFGGIERIKDESRDVRLGRLLEGLYRDARHGLRMLIKFRGFSLVIVLTLALGIGANISIFGLIDVFLLRSLPIKNPEQLVILERVLPDGSARTDFDYHAYEYLRDQNKSFEGTFCVYPARVALKVDGHPELATADFVSDDYLEVMGVRPILGNGSLVEDKGAGGLQTAVISYGYWERRFSRDLSVLGRTLDIGGIPFSVSGVTPAGFSGRQVSGEAADILLHTAAATQLVNQGVLHELSDARPGITNPNRLEIMARLKPGTTPDAAAAELQVIFAQFERQTVTSGSQRSPATEARIRLLPGNRGDRTLSDDATLELRILMAVAVLILILASANVASLLLARTASRQQELAVRLALGASRGRLIRQLLIESLLPVLFGALLGLLAIKWSADGLLSILPFGPKSIPFELLLDARVIAFTVVVSVFGTIASGLAPALSVLSVDSYDGPQKTGLAVSFSGSRGAVMKPLMVAQIAISTILLISLGLLTGSIHRLHKVDTGFDRDSVFTIVAYPAVTGPDRARELNLYKDVIDKISSTAGVRSASLTLRPLYGGTSAVGPGFFATEGIRLINGREFTEADTDRSPKVAIVSERFAKELFPNDDPVGERFSWVAGGGYQIERVTSGGIEIVGVVADIRNDLRSREWLSSFYLPYTQVPLQLLGQAEFLARGAGGLNSITGAIRAQLGSFENELVLMAGHTQADEMNSRYILNEQSLSSLLSAFAVVALFLAGIGLYGSRSFAVGSRIKEFGVRITLGARNEQITRMVLVETLVIVGIGVAIGIPGALLGSRLISSMLFGVKPTDPLYICGGAAIMVSAALIAAYLPARLAGRIDPANALRYE